MPYTHWTQIEVTSRAAAERALRSILADQDHPAPELDPLTVTWETQTEAPEHDNASHLEVKFREVLRKALVDRHATVKDVPNAGQVEWQITFTNGESWKMREQVNKGYTTPDFVFTHRTNPGVRPIAVYTDGAAFHISETHYRFPDDIVKRNRLHFEESWLPWSVTDADIEWFKAEQDRVAEPPFWTVVRNQPELAGFGAGGWSFLKSSPVTQLLTYLANPVTSMYEMSAKALWLLLVSKVRAANTPGGPRLTFNNQIHVGGSVTGEQFHPKRLYVDAPTAGSITDDNWRDFLRFANILWLADAPVVVATSEYDEASAAHTAPEVPAGVSIAKDSTELPAVWADAIEEFEDESSVVAALRLLARAGAETTEEIGEEVGSLPTAVAWPDRKIALLIERDDSYADAENKLRNDGWTLMYPDTLNEQTIPTVLLAKE